MKTYVLDASALFAFLERKPGALKVNEVLKQAVRSDARVLMSAANYGEVYGNIRRLRGASEAMTSMQAIIPLPIEVVDLTRQRAIHAADVKAKYGLYYVDSCAAALAIEHKATLITSDSDFRKLGSGISIVWLKP